MTKFTIVALVQMAVLFVMHVESCSDEFIKETIVKVCGMGEIRRSFPENSHDTDSSWAHYRNSKGIPRTRIVDKHKPLIVGDEAEQLLLKTSNKNRPKGIGAKMAVNKKQGVMQMFRECCVNKNCSLSDLNRIICEKK